jgi:hypothetical protein
MARAFLRAAAGPGGTLGRRVATPIVGSGPGRRKTRVGANQPPRPVGWQVAHVVCEKAATPRCRVAMDEAEWHWAQE